MNPEYLEIENLNSFTDVQTVDFTRYRADRLFCICGDTGAGKTTVLDAIIVALFGIDRGKDDERSKKTDYINVKSDRARVAFSFSTDGKSYWVERTFARSGANKAYFYCDETLIANGADQVNPAVEAVVGLTKDEFTQVIILQQGAFSRFLTAKAGERTETVGKLFRLGKFDLHGKANKIATDYKEQLIRLDGTLEQYAGLNGAKITEEKHAVKAAQKAVAAADGALKKANGDLTAVREKKNKYDAYLAAVAVRDRAEAALRAVVEQGKTLAAQSVEALESAAAEKEAAARDAEQALQTFLRQKKAAEAAAEVSAARETMRKDYRDAEAAGKKLAEQRETAAQAARVAQEKVTVFRAEVSKAGAAAGLAGDDLAAVMKTASERAARLTAAADEYRKQSEKRQAAADSQAELAKQIEAVERLRVQTEAAATTAKERLAEERRNSAAAAVLEGLHDGDACPVCGGVVHMHDVTSDVAAASADYEAKEKEVTALKVRLSDLQARFETARKEASVTLEPPADAAPFARLAQAAEKGLAAEKQYAAADKTLVDLDGKLAENAAKKEGLKTRGVEATKTVDRYTAEAGACAGKTKADLDDEERRAQKAVADFQAAAVAARKTAKETGEARLRLTAEKAKAEGEWKKAAEAVVEAEAVPPDAVANAEAAVATLTETLRYAERTLATAEKTLVDDTAKWEAKKTVEAERAEVAAKYDTADKLARLLKDKALVKFVAEEYIRAFTAAASNRLNRLSNGKYTLSYEDGGFSIGDFLNGNLKRRVVTLSGGETFLASLSMAAALADMLASGAGYGFFFLDEGFGTLDESKLDDVYEALVALSRDTLVGVVTHSERLIEKIPARITVFAADNSRGSRIV